MKKLIFNFAIILSFTALCLTSCKDEDDDAPISGTGGDLTGVWRYAAGDEASGEAGGNYGIRINSNGRVEKVSINGTSVTPLHDYAEGIITNISGNSFNIVGIDGSKTGSFEKESFITPEYGRFVVSNKMRFQFGVRDMSPSDGCPLNGTFVAVGGGSSNEAPPRDNNLIGEWTTQFEMESISFSDQSLSGFDNYGVADWYTDNNTLYVCPSNASYSNSYSYSINGDQLTISKYNGTTTTYSRRGSNSYTHDTELLGSWTLPFGTSTVTFSEESITGLGFWVSIWATEGNQIKMKTGSDIVTYYYNIYDNKLTLRDASTMTWTTYARPDSYTRDAKLMGDWTTTFGTSNLTFTEQDIVGLNVLVSAWYSENDKIYVLSNYNVITYYYKFDNDKLNIREESSSAWTTYMRPGSFTAPQGNCGELGGLWAMSTSDFDFVYGNGNVDGLYFNTDGKIVPTYISETALNSVSQSDAISVITSASNGSFTAIGPNGEFSGTYAIDTTIVFRDNMPMLWIQLSITSSTLYFTIDNHSWQTTYVKLRDINGIAVYENCHDWNLSGIWTRQYYDESNNLFTEYFNFNNDSMYFYTVDKYGNRVVDQTNLWAAAYFGGANWLALKNPNVNNVSGYQYEIYNNDLYIYANGSWLQYQRP